MKPWAHWKIWGIVLILSSFMVWMTGYLGNTYIRLATQPKTNLSQSTSDLTPMTEAQITLTEFDYWTCQVGVFQAEENAKQEKNRLEQLGWETQIVSQKPWSLTIGFAHEPGELVSLRGLLKEGGVATVVKHFVVPRQAYRITGNGAEQTAQILRTVHDFLGSTTDRRGEALPLLEKEISTSWPQKLDQLQQSTAYVLKAERTLGPEFQRLATLRLLIEYQRTLSTLRS